MYEGKRKTNRIKDQKLNELKSWGNTGITEGKNRHNGQRENASNRDFKTCIGECNIYSTTSRVSGYNRVEENIKRN